MRKTYEELNEIKVKLGTDTLWSWSRYNTYKNDPYSYYLRYIKRVQPDNLGGRYGTSGNVCHEILEKLYQNEIKYEDMINEWEAQVMLLDMSDLKYNRADEEMNKRIADKYEACISHFFKHHNMVKGKVVVEEFALIKVHDYYFHGYIDFMHEANGKLYITDFKTSTIYTGKKIEAESGQLVLYAEAIHQRLGIPYEDIVIRWNFLKYVTVGEPTVKGTIKYRNIERNQIGKKLSSKAKLHLKRAGYSEEEINNFILQMIADNSIDCLPNEVKSMYTFDDCYVEIPLSQERVETLKAEIVNTLDEIVALTEEYKRTEDDMLFYKKVSKEDEYYYYNLCDYSKFLHKPWNDYLEEQTMFVTSSDGDEAEDTTEDNLDWLDDLLNIG